MTGLNHHLDGVELTASAQLDLSMMPRDRRDRVATALRQLLAQLRVGMFGRRRRETLACEGVKLIFASDDERIVIHSIVVDPEARK